MSPAPSPASARPSGLATLPPPRVLIVYIASALSFVAFLLIDSFYGALLASTPGVRAYDLSTSFYGGFYIALLYLVHYIRLIAPLSAISPLACRPVSMDVLIILSPIPNVFISLQHPYFTPLTFTLMFLAIKLREKLLLASVFSYLYHNYGRYSSRYGWQAHTNRPSHHPDIITPGPRRQAFNSFAAAALVSRPDLPYCARGVLKSRAFWDWVVICGTFLRFLLQFATAFVRPTDAMESTLFLLDMIVLGSTVYFACNVLAFPIDLNDDKMRTFAVPWHNFISDLTSRLDQ